MTILPYTPPRDAKGRFLSNKLVGYPKGLHEWMASNEREARRRLRVRTLIREVQRELLTQGATDAAYIHFQRRYSHVS